MAGSQVGAPCPLAEPTVSVFLVTDRPGTAGGSEGSDAPQGDHQVAQQGEGK